MLPGCLRSPTRSSTPRATARPALVIRGFILSRRVYVGDSGQQLSVPVYVYRNSLNRIDDLACIYIDQHDVAVLTHNLDNKALGGCKAKLCLCLNINLYNPFCALLSDRREIGRASCRERV